ncbi:MFS transporter [Pedobacter montanisoli]|uniref:MFS transporter n=1 Tax=Pedobacter montanisoli TaxID=2923277 RepID=A0ABS9ZYK2_9SPHI|nr:MFS transporter [Pedobacter montanisoli]MCJ0743409.1 MFS transporter [Pedobacter montanisoli]
MKPQLHIENRDIEKSLRLVIVDGISSEIVVCLTSGAFLVATALLLGASNFQIGLLAAFPSLTNLAQLFSILLMRRFPNRKGITTISLVIARTPLIIIGWLLFQFGISVYFLMAMMFIHYLFSSIGGAGWNSWIKDLVPENQLGQYFSKRSRYMQIVNICLSLLVAVMVDYFTSKHSSELLSLYSVYFILAGVVGLIGTFFLSRAVEPQSYLSKGDFFELFMMPLKNKNFRNMLWFNGAWVFAINLAVPFFMVFMLQTLKIPMTYIIALTVISQVFSVLTVQLWGTLSDRYSNKSIIYLSSPIYIVCIIAWIFVGIYSRWYVNMALLVGIHIFTGVSTAGINLALTNIGLKLAPKTDAVVYLSVKNITTSIFSSVSPLLGGILADYFSNKQLKITFEWISPQFNKLLKLIYLHEWNFLFLIGALLALLSLRLLGKVQEQGEVGHSIVKRIMKTRFKSDLKESFIIGNIVTWHSMLKAIIKRKKAA